MLDYQILFNRIRFANAHLHDGRANMMGSPELDVPRVRFSVGAGLSRDRHAGIEV